MTEGRRSLASVITAIIAAAVLAQLGLLAPANLVVGTLAGVLVWILTAPRKAAPKG